MIDVLGPHGVLASAIPHYEDRPQQRQMAAAVAAAIADERTLIVEAGTGTGKTLAYLIPALLSGKRVIVSTGTRTLQEQISRHDIPLLRALLPPFTAVTLKGVSNYVCRRKLSELRGQAIADDMAGAVDRVAAWVDETSTGDRAELDTLADTSPVWPAVTTTPDARIGPKCPFYETCFVTQARRRAEQADLVLVNHHLFFADLALRTSSAGARVLPDYDTVIFDEAHQLEDVITEHFGVRVSTMQTAQLVRDARKVLGSKGSGPLFGGKSSADHIIEHVERSGAAFFSAVKIYLRAISRGDSDRVELADDVFADEERQEAWFRFDTAVDELAAHAAAIAGEAEEPGHPAESVARRCTGVRNDLAVLAEQSADSFVYWAETRGPSVSLCASPVDIADTVRRTVVDPIASVVLTSATLSTQGTFGYVRQRLGLDEDAADELLVESPFDFASQAMLYIARDLPAPQSTGFTRSCCARIQELLAITNGRAFVLFTSHRALREATARLRDRIDHPVLVQGEQPRASLLDRFRAKPGSVLFATGAFWEGVDVPGDALSLVIIDKLPFAPHTDPLIAARIRHLAAEGREPFSELQLPQAALSLKQGFGRLIRRSDDRGIVAILDNRLVTRSYGKAFVSSLPSAVPRTSSLERVHRWWSQ